MQEKNYITKNYREQKTKSEITEAKMERIAEIVIVTKIAKK
jgi:hypothetical protein